MSKELENYKHRYIEEVISKITPNTTNIIKPEVWIACTYSDDKNITPWDNDFWCTLEKEEADLFVVLCEGFMSICEEVFKSVKSQEVLQK